MKKITVGLFNDSFPPTIDGVANTVVNYARVIEDHLGRAVVATPKYPDVKDDYPFKVFRYPSVNLPKKIGYRAGYPFDPAVLAKLGEQKMDIIHTHCPFVSTVLARLIRHYYGTPIVFTYHTKFDVDIEKRVAFNPLRRVSLRLLIANISACDEVWVVSEGAGENLRSLGYTGEYRLMENGVDFPRGRAKDADIEALRRQYQIEEDETVLLFVGRMMWYKGVRLSLDGLKLAKEQGRKFRMFLVGDGTDRPDMMEYCRTLGIEDRCVFTGAIRDREMLRTYFSMANLFLFPSAYDTNGIVVREAAACSCPSLLLKDTCASEGITDGETGIIIGNTPEEMGQAVIAACDDHDRMRRIGENAAEKIYLSWDDAVERAYARYLEILTDYKPKKGLMTADRIMVQRLHEHHEKLRQLHRRNHLKMKMILDPAYKKSHERMRVALDRLFGEENHTRSDKDKKN